MGDTAEAEGIDKHISKVNECIVKLARIVHPSWRINQKTIKNSQPDAPVTRKTIFDMVVGIKEALTAVSSLLDKSKGQKCPRIAGLEAKVRDLESGLDSNVQKQKVGTLIVTQPPKSTTIKTKDELEVMNVSVAKHAVDLIMKKTNVKVDEEDLKLAHHLPNGNLKVKFRDLKATSKFHAVVTKIKRPLPDEKKVPIYLNFDFTKKRNEMLFQIRRLRREEKIAFYLTDFDGSITVQQKDGGERVRLTRSMNRSSRRGEKEKLGKQPKVPQPNRTYTLAELLKQFDPDYKEEEEEVQEEEEDLNSDASE